MFRSFPHYSFSVRCCPNGGSVGTTSLTAARTTSYSFKSWNTAANGNGTSYTPGASYSTDAAVTLYAQWNSSTRTAAVELPTPTREDYIFQGWATSASATSGVTGSYTPSGNTTLFAVWKEIEKPVLDLGAISISNTSGAPGDTVSLNLSVDTNPGIMFISITPSYDSSLLELVSMEATGSGWTIGTNAIWDADGDVDFTGKVLTLTFKIKETASEGQAVVSADVWAANEDEQQIGFAVEDGTVTIAEHVLPATYIVSYDANGGENAPDAQTKIQDESLTLSNATPTRADASADSYTVTLNANNGSVSPTSLTAARTTSYSFKNWNTAQNGSGTSYAPGASYTANAAVALYAQWNTSTTTAAVTLPTPTRDGYVFQGWTTSADATSGVTGSYTPAKDVTLYAIWKQNTPTVLATIAIDSVNANPGQEITVPIRLENNPGLIGLEFTVSYDNTVLEWIGVESGAYGELGDYDLAVGQPLAWFASDERTDVSLNGVFATLTFRVNANAEDGETLITASYDEDNVFNAAYDNVAFEISSGTVTIKSHIPGDINGDGKVNNKDYMALRRYIKYKDIDVVEAALDINADGKVNNKDYMALRRYIKYKDIEIH